MIFSVAASTSLNNAEETGSVMQMQNIGHKIALC